MLCHDALLAGCRCMGAGERVIGGKDGQSSGWVGALVIVWVGGCMSPWQKQRLPTTLAGLNFRPPIALILIQI